MEFRKPDDVVDTINYAYNCFSLEIWNGEIVYASHADIKENHHILYADRASWETAGKVLKMIFQDYREDFLEIIEQLNKESNGYEIAKKIVESEITQKELEIQQLKEILK